MTKSPINRASALIASALVFSGLVQCQGTMQFTFEGQPPGTFGTISEYSEAGMQFWNPYGPQNLARVGSGLSGAPDNGTAYLQATTGARLAFRFTEFALFNLVSFDVAEYWGYNGTANAAMLQNNGPGGGIGTNWATVPGSTVTNRVVVPIDPANGSVFYRLALP